MLCLGHAPARRPTLPGWTHVSIPDATGRARAIAEAVRVLRPGGQLLITDIRAVEEYRDTLQQMGLADVATRSLGMAHLVRRPAGVNSTILSAK
jgi:SAM-dependent methyltransferase